MLVKSMRSIVAFVFVGGLTTGVHVAVGLICNQWFGLSPFNANLVAFAFGFFVSYFGHRSVTFRSRGRVSRSMPRFFAIAATNLFLNQAIVYSVVNILHRPYWLALAVMVLVVPAFTYVLSRIWAFDDGDPT
jgi:putative flippase GtrA